MLAEPHAPGVKARTWKPCEKALLLLLVMDAELSSPCVVLDSRLAPTVALVEVETEAEKGPKPPPAEASTPVVTLPLTPAVVVPEDDVVWPLVAEFSCGAWGYRAPCACR